jgi:hypothetical protein
MNNEKKAHKDQMLNFKSKEYKKPQRKTSTNIPKKK